MRILMPLLLVAALLGGCASDVDDTDPSTDIGPVGTPGTLYGIGGNLTALPTDLFAAPPLYKDPQNAPHPAFNWPTLAYPAAGELPNPWWAPAPAVDVPAAISDLQLVVQTPEVGAGAGIAIFGSLVLVPGYGQDTRVVDISDPTAPKVLSSFRPQEGLNSHRGAAFIAYPDGKLAAVISTSNGIDVWNLTDPLAPTPYPPLIGDDIRSHKVGVIPGTPIVVNARSNGGSATDPANSAGKSEMWDLLDPAQPVRLPDFQNGYGCHHVYFWNDAEQNKSRGICAGIQYTQIWDTADPYDPKVIVSVPFGSGGTPLAGQGYQRFVNSFSHYAGLSLDGTILLVGDESGGGAGPAGCVTRVDVPGVGSVSVPIGAVWFYDVSDEKDPRYLGHFSASQHEKLANPQNQAGMAASCTAHHGRLVPVEGRDVLAMSFYGAGVVVVDFTDLRDQVGGTPEVVAQFADGSNTWETWYYNGYLYTGDLNRGMDVLRFT